jgi:hypothetical protein
LLHPGPFFRPGWAGYFLLFAQEKVTKEKGTPTACPLRGYPVLLALLRARLTRDCKQRNRSDRRRASSQKGCGARQRRRGPGARIVLCRSALKVWRLRREAALGHRPRTNVLLFVRGRRPLLKVQCLGFDVNSRRCSRASQRTAGKASNCLSGVAASFASDRCAREAQGSRR